MLFGIAMGSVQIEPLYWNTTNPLFDNPSSSKSQLSVRVGEKMDIYCPLARNAEANDLLFMKVFLVSADDVNYCRQVTTSSRLFSCLTPDRERKHTLLFQEINPNPFSPVFSRGSDYFLISLSGYSKEDLERQSLSSCDSKQLRIKISVGLDSAEEETVRMETSRSHVRSLSKSQVDSIDELIELEKDEVELVKTTGFTIGIVIGALTVILLIVLFIFGYRWHSRRGDITKALYIPKPRPASSQVHLTLVPAGSHYPYENPTVRNPAFPNQPRPLSSIYQPNVAGIGQLHPIGNPITKESQEGTYSSTQDSLGETSCGSDLTYLEPNHGGVVEV